MKNRQVSKLQLFCEQCGYEATQLEIVKKHLLYCNECAEAEKRRERLKRIDREWEESEK